MGKRKSKTSIVSEVKTETSSDVRGRQFRDKLTRVTSPVRGKVTNALQWNRWTP
jgi:hypothetical protein